MLADCCRVDCSPVGRLPVERLTKLLDALELPIHLGGFFGGTTIFSRYDMVVVPLLANKFRKMSFAGDNKQDKWSPKLKETPLTELQQFLINCLSHPVQF